MNERKSNILALGNEDCVATLGMEIRLVPGRKGGMNYADRSEGAGAAAKEVA
jgi:hypothetical protein